MKTGAFGTNVHPIEEINLNVILQEKIRMISRLCHHKSIQLQGNETLERLIDTMLQQLFNAFKRATILRR